MCSEKGSSGNGADRSSVTLILPETSVFSSVKWHNNNNNT